MSYTASDTEVVDPQLTRLQKRLADPKTVAAMNRLLDRLDVIALLFEMADEFFRRGDTIAESISDSVAELREAGESEISFAELLERISQMTKIGCEMAKLLDQADLGAIERSGIVRRLSDPMTLDQLKEVLNHVTLVTFTLDALDGFLQRGEVITDSVAEGIGELKSASMPVGDNLSKLLGEDLPGFVRAATTMLQSGMLEPNVVRTLGEIGRVVANAQQETKESPPEPVGVFGVLRALRDPNVQVALGNALHIARRYGEHVQKFE